VCQKQWYHLSRRNERTRNTEGNDPNEPTSEYGRKRPEAATTFTNLAIPETITLLWKVTLVMDPRGMRTPRGIISPTGRDYNIPISGRQQ
jgi:hypothetical protein